MSLEKLIQETDTKKSKLVRCIEIDKKLSSNQADIQAISNQADIQAMIPTHQLVILTKCHYIGQKCVFSLVSQYLSQFGFFCISLYIVRFQIQQRAKQTDFFPPYDVILVLFKRVWDLLMCCHALG